MKRGFLNEPFSLKTDDLKGANLLRVTEFRAEANNLRGMAGRENNRTAKAKLLELADHYDMLANKRQEFLELQEEIHTNQYSVG